MVKMNKMSGMTKTNMLVGLLLILVLIYLKEFVFVHFRKNVSSYNRFIFFNV